jgi:hypothetical protein
MFVHVIHISDVLIDHRFIEDRLVEIVAIPLNAVFGGLEVVRMSHRLGSL